MGEIRTRLKSAEHLEIIGAGDQPVLQHWQDTLRPFYADILAPGRVERIGREVAVRWRFAGRTAPGPQADEEDLALARSRLTEANARVDAVLETLTSIKQRGARGGNYLCRPEEYERIQAIFPPSPDRAPGPAGEVRIPAQSLETALAVLGKVRGSLRPEDIQPQQVVKTDQGPRIIGWGLTSFEVDPSQWEHIPAPWAEEAVPPPATGPTPAVAPEPTTAPPEPAPPESQRRGRRIWPWLLAPLAALALVALLLWWRGCSLPYQPHQMPMGAEHLALTYTPLEPLDYQEHQGPMGAEALVWTLQQDQTAALPVGEGRLRWPIPLQAQGRGLPWVVSLRRDGFRFESAGEVPAGARWTVRPEWVFRRHYPPAGTKETGRPVGVDLYWDKEYSHRSWSEVTGELGQARYSVRRGEGDVLYHVDATGAKAYYWIGVELAGPVPPKDLKVRVLEPTPERLPPGWRELKKVVTLKRGRQKRYFYVFMMPLETLKTHGQQRVKIELSDGSGRREIIERELLPRTSREKGTTGGAVER